MPIKSYSGKTFGEVGKTPLVSEGLKKYTIVGSLSHGFSIILQYFSAFLSYQTNIADIIIEINIEVPVIIIYLTHLAFM